MIYIFHRKEGFYPLELPNDADARANAECNPGTTRVTNETTGEQIWPVICGAVGGTRGSLLTAVCQLPKGHTGNHDGMGCNWNNAACVRRPIEDEFRGDNEHLRACIKALIEMNDDNALVPHGIGGHARALLAASYHRLGCNSTTTFQGTDVSV